LILGLEVEDLGLQEEWVALAVVGPEVLMHFLVAMQEVSMKAPVELDSAVSELEEQHLAVQMLLVQDW
jgi:hypothetical protein